MAILYAARSAAMTKWASDVGLGKVLYKVGVADDAESLAEQAKAGWCGSADWIVMAKTEVDGLTEDEAIERLAVREKMVDPALYPRLKGQRGLFKVKTANVENHILVAKALKGEDTASFKLKPVDIAAYLLHNAKR